MIASVRLPCSVHLCQIPCTSPNGKTINNVLAGSILIKKLTEVPFHSLYALAFTMRPSQEFGVYWDRPFYSKEKGINAKLRKQNC